MTDFTVAPTTEDDIADLRAVLDATGLFPSEMLPGMFATGTGFWLTCRADGAATGLCYTAPEELADGTWNMLALAVHPDMQGKGLGRALVAAAEAELRSDRQRIVIVDTSGTDDFAKTRAFYAGLGYDEEARIRDFWAAGDDKVTFRKAL